MNKSSQETLNNRDNTITENINSRINEYVDLVFVII